MVSNFVSDLKGNNYEAEKVIICHDLYKAFIKFYLDYYGYWNSRHKHLARQMNLSNPTLSGELLKAVRQFHVTLDPTDILDLVNNEMAMIGDAENGYSMYSGLISVKANYMILRYDFRNDPCQSSNMLLKEALRLFPKSIATFVFRSRPLGDDEQANECLYLIVSANTADEINGYYIPKLDGLTLSKETYLSNLHYPVNFDIDLFLGGKNLLNPMLNMLKSISLKYAPLLEAMNDSIRLSLQFIVMFRKAFFCDNTNVWAEFLLFVQNSWIVRAYDNKNIHNIRQLLKAKNMVLDIFAKQYAHQRNSFLSILNWKRSSKEDDELLQELKNLCILVKSLGIVKSYQQHPVNTTEYGLKPEWVIYRNMLDYILGIFMYKESQKPYIIYVLIEIQK